MIDHIDGDRLNNQKSNLRILTAKENSQNRLSLKNSTSQYIGVSYNKTNGKWVSQIRVDGVYFWLGHFRDEIEAAKIRDNFILESRKTKKVYHKLNFPES